VKVFGFDPAEARDTLRRDGWLHVRGGVTDEFLAHLQDTARERLADRPLDGPGLAGAKDQFLFDIPPGLDLGTEVLDVVAAVSGLERATLTLSERHLKAYLPNADPAPLAHKDRLASTVALGISVDVPEGSHVVLWPDDDRGENPHLAPHLRSGLEPDELPEVVLADRRTVEIADRPGDVLLFWGASTWHLRRRSAGAVLLYLKFNDFDCDPLGEDPDTERRRRESMALLDELRRDAGAGLAVRLSRRFEAVVDRWTRRPSASVPMAQVFGEPPFPVDRAEADLLRRATVPLAVTDVLGAGVPLRSVERLVRRDALDLVRRGAR
jgi:hypothetical protein